MLSPPIIRLWSKFNTTPQLPLTHAPGSRVLAHPGQDGFGLVAVEDSESRNAAKTHID